MTHESLPLLDEVTIIVVTYHSAHCLDVLAGLLDHCPHVIISDNGSHDETVTLAQSRWPHARVLSHERNLGFGAANNRALEQVQTPFALLLNPDCELSPAALQTLMQGIHAFPDAAMVAPQLQDSGGRLEVNYRWPSTHWAPQGPAAQGPLCVGFLCGAALLLRLSAFVGHGFFDEDFFLYYEDDDLCLRLFNARLPMLLLPDVVAIHRSRGSVRGRSPWRSEYWRGYHHAQSKIRFASKHLSIEAARRQRLRLIWQTALALPLRSLLFSPRHVARMWGRLRGVCDLNLHV